MKDIRFFKLIWHFFCFCHVIDKLMEKKMLKYLTHELDKDDRDYRRFFQSRNVSLSSFSKFRNLNNDKKVSGRKNKINENSFFPIIAKKMLKI